jgi:DHA3 family macrolide efflux protein-like MFS transporter
LDIDINKDWKKNVMLFLTSQTISLFGSMLVEYAITWYITLETKSGTMMTISIICGFLPTFFISPFAGVWADRYNRKILIMVSDSLIALATFILAVLFFMGYGSIWLIFIVLIIRAFGSGVQIPAINAFIPKLVPDDKLTKVNAVNSSIQSLVFLLSPMLSGALLTIASIEAIFFIDVITAAIAVLLLLLFLHVPAQARSFEKQSITYFGDMREGIKYINSHSFVKTLFIFCAIYYILVTPLSFLTPLQVTRSFGDDVWRLTATEVSYSAGMMTGGIIMTSWGGFKNKIHTMALSNFVIAICTFGLGTVPFFWIYLVLMGLIGIVVPIFNTPFIVLLQQKVEQDFLGRVFGVLNMILSSTMPLSMLVYGPVADYIKIEWLLIGSGFSMLILNFFMLDSKVLIEAGEPVSSE